MKAVTPGLLARYTRGPSEVQARSIELRAPRSCADSRRGSAARPPGRTDHRPTRGTAAMSPEERLDPAPSHKPPAPDGWSAASGVARAWHCRGRATRPDDQRGQVNRCRRHRWRRARGGLMTGERGNGPGSTRILASAVAVSRCGGRLCFFPVITSAHPVRGASPQGRLPRWGASGLLLAA